MENIVDSKMCVLVAPDGSPQYMTLSPDYAFCVALINILWSRGLNDSLPELWNKGYEIIPVNTNITQLGNEEDAFNNYKKQMNEEQTP